MSLRTKVVAVVALIFLLLAAVSFAIQQFVVYPGFIKLEHDEAFIDAERSVAAIQAELDHLAVFVNDWSAWDDTYTYVADRNAGFEKANLVRNTFVDTVNLIYIFDRTGEVVWGEFRNRTTGDEMKLGTLPWDRPSLKPALLNHATPLSSTSGIAMTEHGPMLLASFPVLTSASQGPIRGTLIMGLILDREIVNQLVEQTQIDFKIWPVVDQDIPAEGLAVLERMRPGDGPTIVERDTDTLGVYAVYPGLDRGSDLLIGVEVPRMISASGAVSTRYATTSLVFVGVAIALILLFVLQRIVVGPITDLAKQLTVTYDARESTARIAAQRQDEIGRLAASFNGLLEELKVSKEKLIEAIAQGTVAVTSAEFFPLLLQNLAEVLDVQYAFIAENTDQSGSRIRTLAAWANDHLVENFECDVRDTPCQDFIDGRLTIIQRDLPGRFPKDKCFKVYAAESYCGIPLHDSSGEVIGLLAVLDTKPMNAESERVFTLRIFASRCAMRLEHMRAEQKLRDSHHLLKSIIEGANEGIFLQDIEGRYQLVNPAWARFLGLTVEEFIGHTDEEILIAENVRTLHNGEQSFIAAGGTVSSEKQLYLNGQTRVLLLDKTPFRDADGKIVGIIGVCRDITKLKQAVDNGAGVI